MQAVWKTQSADPASLAGLFVGRTAGLPVRADHVQMIPIFGSPTRAGAFAPPESALSLHEVEDYGTMTLRNDADRPTIAPLNVGYLQQGAQNHAMCTAWIVGAGVTDRFADACCIQEEQGGYISGADERFIVLPHSLRRKAYALRGEDDYEKLWAAISVFNKALGLKDRGHLDQLKQAHQPDLLRTTYRLELHPGQTGAVYLCQGQIVGIELAPDPQFWAELHRPLAMYTYAPLLLWQRAVKPLPQRRIDVAGAATVVELRDRLESARHARAADVGGLLDVMARTAVALESVQTLGDAELFDVQAGDFAGQVVRQEGAPAYISLIASAFQAK